MTFYRFYRLTVDGRIAGLPDPVDCRDDDDASAKAKERASSYSIEVWDTQRRVPLVEPKRIALPK